MPKINTVDLYEKAAEKIQKRGAKVKRRVVIFLNDEQEKVMRVLMKDFLQDSPTPFFVSLMADKYAERKPARKRVAEEDDRTPKEGGTAAIYPHPTSPGTMLNRNELEAWYELQGKPLPPGIFND